MAMTSVPNEVVPHALRTYLRWDHRHDEMAAQIMREFGLTLPRDRSSGNWHLFQSRLFSILAGPR